MNSRIKSWSVAFWFLISFVGPVSAGYIQIVGPEASYDSATDTFSISGDAVIGSPSIAGPAHGAGYQSLTAQIDNSGTLSTGTYSLFGTIPSAGIHTPTLLISARVASVSVFAAASIPSDPTAGGGISMTIFLDNIFVAPSLDADPNLGGWGRTAFYCCDVYNLYNGAGSNSAVATPQTPWASSWSGYFASDYSDISSRPIPEPASALLLLLGGAALRIQRRQRSQTSSFPIPLSAD